MEYFFRTSGEHPALPTDEIFALLDGCGIDYEVTGNYPDERLLVLSTKEEIDDLVGRLGMTLSCGRVIASSNSLEGLFPKLKENIGPEKTIAVRSSSTTDDRALGALFYSAGYRINLSEPDVEIRAYKTPQGYIAGTWIPLKKGYSRRRPQFRPYFSPISMHPKLARVLVNLSRVKQGDTLLDPFCGTGGVLIEAGLVGLRLLGSDIDEKMVYGCRRNLEFYRLSGDIRRLDVSSIKEFGEVDAVVTDPPYARASYVTERDLQGFYGSFVSSVRDVLKPGGFLVYMVPERYTIDVAGMVNVAEYRIRVHKSLTRKVVVQKKEG